MVNTSKVDGQGNIVREHEATVYFNTNMGSADRMDQQLHGNLIMLPLLSSHKLYKSRGGKI